MAPLLDMGIFPNDLLHALQLHLKDPMASSYSDTRLTHLFRRYDGGEQPLTLRQIDVGKEFEIRGRIFRKGKLRRTRFLCTELKSGTEYLVPADAEVTEIERN